MAFFRSLSSPFPSTKAIPAALANRYRRRLNELGVPQTLKKAHLETK
jgi:hypothetical protein